MRIPGNTQVTSTRLAESVRYLARRASRTLVLPVTLGLVVAMPLAMLPNLELGASAASAAGVATGSPVSALPTNASASLPTVPGGRPGTGEGAILKTPVPSPGGLAPTARSTGASSDAVVGSPPIELLPSMLNVPNTIQPSGRDRSSSTYDSAHNQVVNFGGCTAGLSASCTAWSNQTHTFDGTHWTLQAPTTSPSGRTDQTLTFDPTTGTAVLFGGENASGALSDTWVWNGTTWTQSTGTTHPSARYGAVSAYLPSTGLVYLFGGKSSSSYLNDTWSWNGTTWTQLSPTTSPPVRALASMAYAGTLGPSANDLLLYGGTNSSGDLGDTWLWNGTNWSNPTLTEGPGPLEQSAIVYDPTMHVPLLYGGIDGTTVDTGLWAWNGSEWIEGAGNQAVGLYGMTMAQDPANGQLVINSGEYSSTSTNYETFKVDYINGHPQSGTQFNHPLDDRLTETIDPTTGALHLRQNDFNVNGVGMPLQIQQNLDYQNGCTSQYFGCNWTAGFLDVVTYSQPDGNSKAIQMPDGSITVCPWNGTTWACVSVQVFP